MSFSMNEWLIIASAVERRGGAILPDRCVGKPLTYKTPDKKSFKATTQGCGHERQVVLPYEPSDVPKERREMLNRGAGFIRVCNECDMLGLWPEYAKALAEDEGQI